MRTITWNQDDEDWFDNLDFPTKGVDWKVGPETTLEEVDEALRSHGLEIVMIDTGGDEISFGIDKRRE
jgi:hypothetical protein